MHSDALVCNTQYVIVVNINVYASSSWTRMTIRGTGRERSADRIPDRLEGQTRLEHSTENISKHRCTFSRLYVICNTQYVIHVIHTKRAKEYNACTLHICFLQYVPVGTHADCIY